MTIMTATVVSAALSEGGLERNDEEGLDYSGRIPTFDGTLDDKAFHEYMQHLDEINKDILDRDDGLDVKEEEGVVQEELTDPEILAEHQRAMEEDHGNEEEDI